MAAARLDDEDIKNRIHDNEDFQKFSKVQAATDSRHDLGTDFTSIYTATQNIGTPQESYDAKLEDQGWKVVNKIVQNGVIINEIDIGTEKFVPMPYGDKIKINHNNFQYELTTMNIEYDESKKMENARKLYDFITDEQEVCLILDATTGDFQKIFLNAIGTAASAISPAEKRKIYYIVNRETISDPAGKPNEKDIDFRTGAGTRNEKRDIEITVALDVSEDKVLYPRWKDATTTRTDFHSDFFSNFTIELTPVQYGVSKIVMLVFTGEDYSNTSVIETSAAGKLTNSVNAMKTVLKKMANKVQEFGAKIKGKLKTKDDPNTINDYFITLQKKRSGDALIALSFFDTERLYHLEKGENFTFKEKPRFVLTHDTFNTLPVSLMNGADVIYTAQSTVYKFKRIREGEEKRDYTKIFFDKYIKTDAERNMMIALFGAQNDSYFKRGLNPLLAELKAMLATIQPFSITATRLTTDQIKMLRAGITSCLQLFFKLALFRSLYMPLLTIEILLSEIDAVSKQDYTDSLKQRIDKIKEVYTVQKIKDNEYTRGFDKFTNAYVNNTVYKEIGKFEPFLETNQYTFGKKENKLTFGSSPIIHAFLHKEDEITEFLDIIEKTYKNENVFGARGQKNKAPLNEILSTFLELDSLLGESETSVKTNDLLVAAHEEIGVPLERVVPTFEGTQRLSENKKTAQQQLAPLEERIGDVASVSSTIPYHTGISQRVVETANTLISSLTRLFTGELAAKQRGGAKISEKQKLQFYSFILFNYMVEMNQYFEGEYNDPDLDIYGQTIPMAGKLLLHAMSTSPDIQSLFFFFIKMTYYANNKDLFEKEYSGTLKGNKSLYFLPCIVENILYNAFGPEFLVNFQDFSVKAYPQIMKNSKLRYLMPPMPEMTNPSWLQVEKDIKTKIIQVTRYLEDEPQMTPTGKRVRNWVEKREKVAAIGGVRYKKTRKSKQRTTKAKSRRHKK